MGVRDGRGPPEAILAHLRALIRPNSATAQASKRLIVADRCSHTPQQRPFMIFSRSHPHIVTAQVTIHAAPLRAPRHAWRRATLLQSTAQGRGSAFCLDAAPARQGTDICTTQCHAHACRPPKGTRRSEAPPAPARPRQARRGAAGRSASKPAGLAVSLRATAFPSSSTKTRPAAGSLARFGPLKSLCATPSLCIAGGASRTA
jgi:hypothetical protein